MSEKISIKYVDEKLKLKKNLKKFEKMEKSKN